MSFLLDAQAWLNATLGGNVAVEGGVTLARPGSSLSTSGVVAWVGRTVFRQQAVPQSDPRGSAYLIFGERDYLVPAADYVLGGVAVLPQRGDQITEAGVGTFELFAPGGEPHWRYSDQTRTLLRLHTKRVS